MEVPERHSSLLPEVDLNPRKSPPGDLKNAFKHWKSLKDESLLASLETIDSQEIQEWSSLQESNIDTAATFQQFVNGTVSSSDPDSLQNHHVKYFKSKIIPGLIVFPNFLDPVCQIALLERLMCRDLSNTDHKTNLSLHYDIKYPSKGRCFMDYSPEDIPFIAKDPTVHPDLSMKRALESKLRWITLGGQYDWTRKEYPDSAPPAFPKDIRDLLHGTFPEMEPQAAIVNFYSPGDTLSMHRDVSEEVDRGLVSISLGCEGIFIIGIPPTDVSTNGSQYQVLRLRSGDAVYMSDQSRYAWHGVPKIIPNSCPTYLEYYPGKTHPDWAGYMKNKRINLNVRQMF